MEGLIESIEVELHKVHEDVVGNDFERVKEI